MFKVTRRGKFSQLENPDGGAVEVKLFGCAVVAPKYEASGKWYAKFDLTHALGRHDLMRVAEFIDTAAAPRFSPLRYGFNSVVMKLDAKVGTKWETPDAATFEFPLEPRQVVDLVVAPGAFGQFGWCIIVKRIKRSGPESELKSNPVDIP